MKINFKALAPLLLFGGLILAFAIGLTRDPRVLPSQLINKPFPEFELTGVYDDTPVSLADLKGEVSLVNVFGSWCVACLQEHPLLMDLARTDQVRVVGINWRDDRDKARQWLNRHGDPYELLIYDPHSTLVIDLGITGAPETFIVDQDGMVRYKHVGIITPELWKETMRPIIRSLRSGS